MASNLLSVVRRQFSTSLRQRAAANYESSATAPDSHGSTKTWKMLTFFLAMPGILFCMVNAYQGEMEHKAHGHRAEFIAYPHLRIRSKPFFWGDGNHSLFHNLSSNALPEGYEDEE